MDTIIYILSYSLFLLIIAFFIISFFTKAKNKKIKEKIQKISNEDKYLAIDELRKILKLNPGNHAAREKLAEMLTDIKSYLPAIKEYMILLNYAGTHPELNELKLTLKVANIYEKLENIEEAKRYYLLAKRLDDFNVEANIALGKIEILQKDYEKAIYYLNYIVKTIPDNLEAKRYIGIAYFYVNKFKNCIENLNYVLKFKPEDFEVLYFLAQSYYKLNRLDEAIKYFSRLKTNDMFSHKASYILGMIHKRQKIYLSAIDEFQIAIQSNKLNEEELLEAYYNLGECYVSTYDLNKAIGCWQKILNINSNYKDVQEKIETYSQLNSNSLLEKYLIGSINQFTNLSQLFIKYYIAKFSKLKGFVKIIKTVTLANGSMEFYVEVTKKNFTEQYYFLFMRSVTTIGDLSLRGIYNKLKEEKIDKGVCITAGNFSDTAKDFATSRMIELVDKNKLNEILADIKDMLNQ